MRSMRASTLSVVKQILAYAISKHVLKKTCWSVLATRVELKIHRKREDVYLYGQHYMPVRIDFVDPRSYSHEQHSQQRHHTATRETDSEGPLRTVQRI